MKTITNLKDFCPKTTIVIDCDANFNNFPEITHLGNLQEIKGNANFRFSKIQSLGNLQTIGGWANFSRSQVQSLGKLQTIGGWADFENSQVQELVNLQTIGGDVHFDRSQVQYLGNLQTIGGDAYFVYSQVQSLGNLQTIGGIAYFGSRFYLEAEWKKRISEKSNSDMSIPEKTFQNTDSDGAKKNVSDIQFWGDGDTFKLISKAWSKKEGWMKSTKAMEIKGVGCVIQVTTQQGSNVAEALTFVPNAAPLRQVSATAPPQHAVPAASQYAKVPAPTRPKGPPPEPLVAPPKPTIF